ncbi:SseB family protein [Arthrobacter sp. Sa2BUA2]|uniref:SseB family protein n=1 Tax=Arthrobacter pullicola TaxID=2762224 RepID=A0ABR8YFA6_9MICC|nr:SseB family protein [Arthrobacter pullicola]MBD8042880.1 SseB family protein [Arthrobacter pullicola]
MAKRELPGHIAAALAGAGGATDSAGQPWAGRSLEGDGNPLHQFDKDDGKPDAGYTAALEALVAGKGTEAEVVASLATARVYVAIIATLGEEAESEHGLTADKEADLALVTLTAPDGRKALPVFSSVDSLARWHPQARPVAVYAPRAALSAVAEEAQLLVIDPGSEMTFVVRRPATWALAQQRAWVPSYADDSLTAIVSDAAAAQPVVRQVQLSAAGGVASRTAGGTLVSGGGAGPELRITLQLVPGLEPEEVQTVAAALQRSLAAHPEFVERVDSLELKITR